MPPRLELKEFRFIIRASERISLPEFCGSALRGAFGHAFRRRVCIFQDGACGNCLLKQTCAYSYIFETPLEGGDLARHGGSFAPHPFVLCPPWDSPGVLDPGDRLDFHCILIGRALQYLPYFILAVEEMGHQGLGLGRGRFRLDEVVEVRPARSQVLYSAGRLEPSPAGDPLVWTPEHNPHPDPGEMVIQMVTPLRFQSGGRLVVEEFDFGIFFRTLLRRIKLLAHYHCGNGGEWDLRPVLEHTRGIQTLARDCRVTGWLRWSQRQFSDVRLSGVTGFLRIAGELKPILPYLEIGQIIHVGKATAFGFGRYQLNPDFTQELDT